MLRDRNAALFAGVSFVGGFAGTAMSLVASIWVLGLTGSSSLAALIGFCLYLPSAFGPVLGAVVDRLPRQLLLIWTEALTAAAMLALLVLRDARQVWLLFVVMLGYGAGHVVRGAAEAALLPQALPDAALGSLNGIRMSVQEGMKLIAPLIGAGLFAWAGGPAVAALVAAMLAVSASLYAFVRPMHHVSLGKGRRRQGIRDGLRYLWAKRPLRAIVVNAAVAVPMSGFAMAASYAVVIDDLHRPAAFLGVLASAQGAGSIVGGLVAGKLMTLRGEAFLGGTGGMLFALATLGRTVPFTWVTVASSVITGVGLLWTVVAAMTAVQRLTAQEFLGRVAATASSVIFAPTALAIPAGAALIVVTDHRVPLAVTGIACLLAAFALRQGLPKSRL